MSICAAGQCQWCGCTFRKPTDVMNHRCAAMQEAIYEATHPKPRDVFGTIRCPRCGCSSPCARYGPGCP